MEAALQEIEDPNLIIDRIAVEQRKKALKILEDNVDIVAWLFMLHGSKKRTTNLCHMLADFHRQTGLTADDVDVSSLAEFISSAKFNEFKAQEVGRNIVKLRDANMALSEIIDTEHHWGELIAIMRGRMVDMASREKTNEVVIKELTKTVEVLAEALAHIDKKHSTKSTAGQDSMRAIWKDGGDN